MCVCVYFTCLCLLINAWVFLMKARAIIYKYLNVSGNSLGTRELNAIGGPNLCSLDVDVLRTISPASLR